MTKTMSAEEARAQLAWWQDTIVYECYPKSFLDTKGQGTGTLAGVTQKLDYLAELGVGAIWLTPIYASPQKDNGYDISNYYDIDPSYGTMADMDELIAQARERGIRIVMDLVMNHTSNENAWFVESASSRDNARADWYIWRDAREDGSAPTNWRGIFGGSAWTWCEARQQYYLHTFGDFQPDLNWECEELRQELYSMARFWLDKGVGGFRIDAVTYIKKPELADGAPDAEDGLVAIHDMTANTPGILDFLREFKAEVMVGTDAFTVAEANGVDAADLPQWVGENGAFDMLFEFSHMKVPLGGTEIWYRPVDWRLTELKAALTASQASTAENGWYPIYFENHDQPRSPNHFFAKGADAGAAARVLACVLMCLRGTPFVYQGEELGYTNVAWPSIEDYDDVSSKNQYTMALAEGCTGDEALSAVHDYSRDNARTPMQWDASANAGFTTGEPWLPVHDSYAEQNVAAEEAVPTSILAWYKSLAKLRAEHPVLAVGGYHELLAESERLYAFERVWGDERALVVANFSAEGASYDASIVGGYSVSLSCGDAAEGRLGPLAAAIYLR